MKGDIQSKLQCNCRSTAERGIPNILLIIIAISNFMIQNKVLQQSKIFPGKPKLPLKHVIIPAMNEP